MMTKIEKEVRYVLTCSCGKKHDVTEQVVEASTSATARIMPVAKNTRRRDNPVKFRPIPGIDVEQFVDEAKKMKRFKGTCKYDEDLKKIANCLRTGTPYSYAMPASAAANAGSAATALGYRRRREHTVNYR